MRLIITVCRLCDTPTNRAIWCSDSCMVWNSIYTKEMFRKGVRPSRQRWQKWCEKVYGQRHPRLNWAMTPDERATAAIYQPETNPRWLSSI